MSEYAVEHQEAVVELLASLESTPAFQTMSELHMVPRVVVCRPDCNAVKCPSVSHVHALALLWLAVSKPATGAIDARLAPRVSDGLASEVVAMREQLLALSEYWQQN